MSFESITANASIIIRKPLADAFAVFADADKMSRFWFTRRDDGLEEGENSTWYLGEGENEFAFEVLVREFVPPHRIVIEWYNRGHQTQVAWSFDETDEGDTVLTIVESGYGGSDTEIIDAALDSTGGFNQVIVAAKALVEHDVALQLTKDHA